MRPWLFLVIAEVTLLAQVVWAGEGAVALQTAATSCRTTKTPPPRYVDCGNGTVTDNKTGLVWLKDANCIGSLGGGSSNPIGAVDWHAAMEFVAGLSDKPASSALVAAYDCGLSDGSSPGEWRLASFGEWEAMVAEAKGLGCIPTITNDSGSDCWAPDCVTGGTCSFSGVVWGELETPETPPGFLSIYWSATNFLSTAFGVELSANSGSVLGAGLKNGSGFVWPVRGGQ